MTLFDNRYRTKKKGVEWNAPLVCTKQVIYYLFITFDGWHIERGILHLQHTLPNDSQNCQKLGARALDLWLQFHPESHASVSVLCVCERILYKHSFKLAYGKKSGTVRSGERTGNGIPDTRKCFSSLVKTPHTPPIHCHRTGFETAYHFLLGLQALTSTPPRSAKVCCETCQSTPHHPV